MGFINRLFGKKAASTQADQCVLIHLDSTNLPDEIYAQYDLSTLEDQLVEAIAGSSAGEFDGDEVGPECTTLFTYGPDADKLYEVMESALRSYPLCKGARIVIRYGPPGSAQKEFSL